MYRPGHPLFPDGHNGTAILGDLVIVSHELTANFPAQTLNAIFRKKKVNSLYDFSYLRIAHIDEVPGQKAEQLLLDESDLIAAHIVHMELLTQEKISPSTKYRSSPLTSLTVNLSPQETPSV